MTRSLQVLSAACLLLLAPFPPAARAQAEDRQHWIGDVQTGIPANPLLQFMFTIWPEGPGWRGLIDIPPGVGIGGAWSVELLSVEVQPGEIKLVQPPGKPGAQPNTFEMTPLPDQPDVARGRLLIGGVDQLTARMWRVSADDARDFMPRRPQLPLPPRAHEERRVAVPCTRGGQTEEVAGVLTLPRGSGPFPAVVLVNAMDFHDLDHSSMGHKPFLVLADRLARAGIATLRTADRSPLKPGLAAQTQVTIEQLGREAAERAAWLIAQDGIDRARIGVLGLNEGATAAAVAAAENPELIKCVVLLAPQAMRGIDQLRAEFSQTLTAEGETAEFIGERTATFIRPYELLIAGAPEAEVLEAVKAEMTRQREARRQQLGEATPEVIAGMADQQWRIINLPDFRANVAFDPAPIFSRVTQPALAILGGKDSRYPAGVNAPALEGSLGARRGVKTVIRLGENLNHRLQPAVSGNMTEITEIELTFDESVLSDVAAFLQKHIGPTSATGEIAK